jgi:TIR domain-containing protein
MSDDVIIFMSYAHDDDLILSPDPDEPGFVSFLDQQLRLKLRDLGARQAKVWRDRRRISQGDQFADIIDDGLSQAELLVVVMSPNWMQRPYCRKEFETFLSLRKAAGVTNPATRMLVVGKGYVDRIARPPELQGQEGFLFYSRDDENDVGAITPFFNRGKCNDRFYAELDDLAGGLHTRVAQILSGAPTPPQTIQQTAPIVTPNGRTVFLAKPASDMKAAYVRLVTELQGKGFNVAPDPSADAPSDKSPEAVVTDALSSAEVFVHLVGDSGGFAPEGLGNIVTLQLALARAKAAQAEGAVGQKLTRRIVWAPKILDGGGATPNGPAVERDPLKSLERFDQQIATDKIDGDILSKFIEFLFQYLTETAPKPVVTAAAGNKLDLYLAYHAADEDYAGVVAQALLESSVKPRIPVADSDADARRYNSDLLAKCDAVTLCWGNASEVWVRSEADRLSDWQALGRKGQFAFRGLIAGPPPASHKKKNTLSLIFQDGEFDKVIDLVETGPPTAQLLADLTSAPSPKP